MHVATVRPVVEPYLPASHGVQLVAPAGEYVPAEQSPLDEEVVRPGVEPYLPAGHGVQVPTFPREYIPSGHIILPEPEPLVEVLPYLSIEPAGQL